MGRVGRGEGEGRGGIKREEEYSIYHFTEYINCGYKIIKNSREEIGLILHFHK